MSRFTLGQMTLHPRLSRTGLDLVKRFEGLRRRAARLDNGGWTIGYGHTVSAREGAQVTPEEAEALLLYDLDKVARAVEQLTFTPLNANQFAALTAFAFNIGLENFRTSAVLKRINEGAYLQAAAALELWRKADFHGDALVVDALVRRRAAEKSLFLTPPEGYRPVPTPVVRAAFDAAAADLDAQSPGLAQAADVWVSLVGDTASAEIYEPAPGAATTMAARNVSARLQQLFPESDASDAVATAEPAPPPVEPGAQAEPVAGPEPEPAPPIEPVVAEAPLPTPDALFEAPPLPVDAPALEDAAPPPPPLFDPPPAFTFESSESATLDSSGGEFGRRAGGPSPDAAESAIRSPTLHAPVVLIVGLFGAAMFIGALAAMIYGMATVVNLAIGLLGVICMVPAGLKLLLAAFGDRPPQDREV